MTVSIKILMVVVIYILTGLLYSQAQSTQAQVSSNDVDPYAWMEQQPQRTTHWLQQQTARSRKVIDRLPWRMSLATELKSHADESPTTVDSYDTEAGSFYLKTTADFPYLRLFVQQGQNKARLLIDPPVGFGISFFAPSDNGAYVAYGLSEHGAETTAINIMEVATGNTIRDTIPQVRYPNIIWNPDNASFFYTTTPALGSHTAAQSAKGQSIYLHHIGQPHEQDAIVFEIQNLAGLDAENHEHDSVNLYTSPDSAWFIASLSPSISGYGNYIYAAPADAVRQNKAVWRKVIDIQQQVSAFIFSGHWLYLAQYNATSGYTISRLDLDNPHAAEETILAWSQGTLTSMNTSSEALYIAYHDSGVRRFVRIPYLDIHAIQDVPRPFDGDVTAISANVGNRNIAYTLQGWTQPPRTLDFNPDAQSIVNTTPDTADAEAFANYQVEELWVTSHDKVRVPLTIIRRRDAVLDGSAPTWLTAYGAYGDSTEPYFDASRLLWLERGGSIAIAHIRGGGELGPAWHEGGRGAHKINSIADFISCADYLVAHRYTKPAKLVISGQSAGGITIGMALMKRPELFAAAAIDVGMLNMSRLDQIPIGPMNFQEFGSPDTRQGMRDLLAIDAYRHLQPGVRYPAVLLTLGMHDERVSPWQSAKFAARLQAVNASPDSPVLILAQEDSGHSSSSRQQADEQFLDLVSFFIWRTNRHHSL